ncbi:MAG TPA: GNAT family N-acetyltransferase [Phototrophicaceae bacterium]|nr:GNAT family N-acetyltransferase [Phototrophicaceae bacterium]
MAYTFTLENSPASADIAAVRTGLQSYNLACVPELLDFSALELAVIARDDAGSIIGGVHGEVDWGWFFPDIVWVSDSQRGQGLGAQLMAAVEQALLAVGINRAYLWTTSFQARPFYLKLGYIQWAEMENRPQGHACYYLKKEHIEPVPLRHNFEIQLPPPPADAQFLDDALVADVARHRPLDYSPLAVFLRDDEHILGGIVGATYWDWFDLRFMWVSDHLRGQGYGSRLLALAEEACLQRGIRHVVTDTADFQALPFYQHHGFEIFGTLADRPPGHTSYYLRKSLSGV